MQELTKRALILALVAVLALIPGCGYGKIGPKAYEYATALYSICNRKDEKRLTKLARLIDESAQKGELSEQEVDWLRDIIEQGKAGDWQDAATNARRLMKDQVKDAP